MKSWLSRRARIIVYHSLILPIFDYVDIVWGDEDNAALMNNLAPLQNKAVKSILDCPLH